MAASSAPSQRKISVSTLVYSTLGPSLGLLPDEQKGDWVVVSDGGEAKVAAGAASSSSSSSNPNNEEAATRPPHYSSGSVSSETQHQVSQENGVANSKDDTGSVLSRLYSAAGGGTSGYGEQGRLNFKAKTGAGSISTMEQATLSKQSSVFEDPPLSPVSKQLQSQISPKSSIEHGEPSPRLVFLFVVGWEKVSPSLSASWLAEAPTLG